MRCALGAIREVTAIYDHHHTSSPYISSHTTLRSHLPKLLTGTNTEIGFSNRLNADSNDSKKSSNPSPLFTLAATVKVLRAGRMTVVLDLRLWRAFLVGAVDVGVVGVADGVEVRVVRGVRGVREELEEVDEEGEEVVGGLASKPPSGRAET